MSWLILKLKNLFCESLCVIKTKLFTKEIRKKTNLGSLFLVYKSGGDQVNSNMAWCRIEKCLVISLISSTPDPWSLDFLHSALSAKFSNETIMNKFLHHSLVPTENMVQSLVAFFILGFHPVSEYNQVPLPWSNFYYVFLGTCELVWL